MLQMMLRIFNNTGDTEGASIINARMTGKSNVEVKEEVKTSMQEETEQVVMSVQNESEKFSDDISDVETSVEDEEPIIKDSSSVLNTSQFNEGVADSLADEDATDSLKELFGSIF